MVHARDPRAAGEHCPVFGRRSFPELCRIHAAAGSLKPGAAVPPDQHLAVGQQRGVEVAPAEFMEATGRQLGEPR